MATYLVCVHVHTMNKIYFQLSVCMDLVWSVLFHRPENTGKLKRNRICKCNSGTTDTNFPQKDLIFLQNALLEDGRNKLANQSCFCTNNATPLRVKPTPSTNKN